MYSQYITKSVPLARDAVYIFIFVLMFCPSSILKNWGTYWAFFPVKTREFVRVGPVFCSQIHSPLLGGESWLRHRIAVYRPARLHRLAGRNDNPMPESTITLSQGLWIWPLDQRVDCAIKVCISYHNVTVILARGLGSNEKNGWHCKISLLHQLSMCLINCCDLKGTVSPD